MWARWCMAGCCLTWTSVVGRCFRAVAASHRGIPWTCWGQCCGRGSSASRVPGPMVCSLGSWYSMAPGAWPRPSRMSSPPPRWWPPTTRRASAEQRFGRTGTGATSPCASTACWTVRQEHCTYRTMSSMSWCCPSSYKDLRVRMRVGSWRWCGRPCACRAAWSYWRKMPSRPRPGRAIASDAGSRSSRPIGAPRCSTTARCARTPLATTSWPRPRRPPPPRRGRRRRRRRQQRRVRRRRPRRRQARRALCSARGGPSAPPAAPQLP
mmetsp:Transcript_18108/g.50252  ORF Transcript_18108/g.50252 Transcript_18108/m.50252 type:complete len:266 (-) Transcript_18108:56-853(-)